jgi:hypothetical protein
MCLPITLHYIALHYITLHYITLHYITLHYITLHYSTLHYITLHCIHSTDRHVLAIMQADLCRAHLHNQEVMCLPMLASVVVVAGKFRDSTSSRLLPGSSYSCCTRKLHALVHKYCYLANITTAHETLQRRKWQFFFRLATVVAGNEKSRWASSSTGRWCILKAAHRLQPRENQTTP